MKAVLLVCLLAGSMALAVMAEPALACPANLQCANFTDSAKRNDCNYMAPHLQGDEEQDFMCILWDQSYEYTIWEPEHNDPFSVDVALEAEPIDNSSFILAGKITIFGLLNYVVFSLTKSSWIIKWLTAAS